MTKQFITTIILAASSALSAQEVVSTQGGTQSNESGSIDYTIGEVSINTATDGVNTLTQGFHQTNWQFLGLENHAPTYTATVFPNPTSELLNIKASDFEGVTYTLYNSEGAIVTRNSLDSELTTVPVSELATGAYTLLLSKADQNLKTIKLVKLN